ncbi:MAG: 6-carboxytetrahydropterin synthase [Bdellovibrionales bacterium]|nr:6-carboxytetrahydropterin synthase [Bdellovibrionales bacterium]
MPESYEIRIRKEALKFASSHMTVFPDGTKEAIHGHQYMPTVSVKVRDVSFKKMLPFADVKDAMKKIAALWDERLLIATENPHFKLVKKSKAEIEFKLCKKRYVFPAEEVVLLKIDNVTCEALAKAYHEFLEMELDFGHNKNIGAVSVLIEESPGQGALYTHE